MTDAQWQRLLEILDGRVFSPPPLGFIIDSPWLPHWAGMAILDYYAGDELWLDANLRASAAFPEAILLPGFWAEFGMCTEPSAFGARCSFPPDEFPFAHPVLRSMEDIEALKAPDPSADGLAPFVLNRLVRLLPEFEPPTASIYAVYPSRRHLSAKVRAFTDFLAERFARSPDWRRGAGVAPGVSLRSADSAA